MNGSCIIGADDTLVGEPETIDYAAGSFGPIYIILDSFGAGTGGPWTLDYSITCELQACCDLGGNCIMEYSGICWQQGNIPGGPGSNCENTQCVPDPVEPSTWGRIKATYR